MGNRFILDNVLFKKFNNLTVIKYLGYDGCHHHLEMLCDCGNITTGSWNDIRSGRKKGCGCLRGFHRALNLTNQKFGKLTALARAENKIKASGKKEARWLCICECGKEVIVIANDLTSGNSQSCGCGKIKYGSDSHLFKHGIRKHPKYMTWCHIIDRCENPHYIDYKNYGARDIRMIEPWRSHPELFIQWYEERCKGNYRLAVDRINNDGPYSPENCRLVTSKQNNRNKRNHKMVEIYGETLCLAEAVEKYGKAQYSTIQNRLAKGWDVELAFTTIPH